MGLIQHLESRFGKIVRGWSRTGEREIWPFQVVEMSGDFLNVCTFTTIGLSNYGLQSPVSSKVINQEIFFQYRCQFNFNNSASVLHTIGMSVLENKRPLLRGDIIDQFDGIIFEGTLFEAFYTTVPAYYPPEFGSCPLPSSESAVICWLIPITNRERLFIKNNGWRAFEELIERKDPDFFDLGRADLFG
jgi:Suppressor of fused protein (SUFU)